ncbi:SHD1 domain-containing protein [Haloferula sp.]|uniref:SHD1 domain-containing protein n=1 Tax=Haloferula sp. TaxID=2497595 RepID=UPI0032A0A536
MTARHSALTLLLALCLIGTGHTRTWTDQTGRQLEADFVRIEDEKVVLKLTTGNPREVKIKIETLSKEDQNHLETLGREALAAELNDPKKFLKLTHGEHELHLPITDDKLVKIEVKHSSAYLSVDNSAKRGGISQTSQRGSFRFREIPDLKADIEKAGGPMAARSPNMEGFFFSEDRRAILTTRTDERGRTVFSRECRLWQKVEDDLYLCASFHDVLYSNKSGMKNARLRLREILDQTYLDGEKLDFTDDLLDLVHFGKTMTGKLEDLGR